MLADQKILTADDCDQIIFGLQKIEQEIAEGTFTFSEQLEDIHMNIETRLAELIGDRQNDFIQPVREMTRSPLILDSGCGKLSRNRPFACWAAGSFTESGRKTY